MATATLTNSVDFEGSYGAAASPVVFSSNTVTTTIVRGLTATKTADKEYWVNGPLTYTVTVTNDSGDIFTKGVLTDNLDVSLVTLDTAAGVRINNTPTSDYTIRSGVLTVNLPDMQNGETVTVTFRVEQIAQ